MKDSNANENVSWKKTQLHRFSVENLSLARQVNFTWNCRNAAIKIPHFEGLNIIVASLVDVEIVHFAFKSAVGNWRNVQRAYRTGSTLFSAMCCVIATSMQPFSQMLSITKTMKLIGN